MNTTKIYQVYPTISSLQNNETDFFCPVDNCEKVLKSPSALSVHLSRHHKNDNSSGQILCYHCPVDGCLYDKSSERHFKCLKYLKQHYRKVHAAKTLQCSKCSAGFSQQALLNAHVKQCGKIFECSCGSTYTSREALLTHAKRKQHEITNNEYAVKKKLSIQKAEQSEIKEANIGTTPSAAPIVILLSGRGMTEERKDKIIKPRLMLPKPAPMSSIPLPTLAALALSELSVFREATLKSDNSTQTDFMFNGSHELCCLTHHCPRRSLKRSTTINKSNGHANKKESNGLKRLRCTAQTQTRGSLHGKQNKRQKMSAQTQTLDNRILEKAMAEANLLITCSTSSAKENMDYFPRQSAYTQTILGGENIDQPFWSILDPTSPVQPIGNLNTSVRNTSSTQTCVNDTNERQCNSSQTERDVFLGHMESSFALDTGYGIVDFPSNSLNSETQSDSQSNVTDYADVLGGSNISQENPVHTIETQTELDLDSLLLCDSDEQPDDSILCFNMQTQTTNINLESIHYDQLLTNMHTQTNEFLFPELSFSDIQTQTSWNDVVFSENILYSNNTQTQTNVAQTQTFTSQMETGTAVTNSHTQTHKI